jgi:hypothetical protein
MDVEDPERAVFSLAEELVAAPLPFPFAVEEEVVPVLTALGDMACRR